MDNKKIAVVLSDIHIGSGILDDFDDEIENLFCDFLIELSSRDMPIELIFNGDFLDFVQASPWEGTELRSISQDDIPLCFTEDQSLEKLSNIYKSHKDVFKAIGDFLNSRDDNRLTILPGNHDVDFFWERVRNNFISIIEPQTYDLQVNFHLEQYYRPEGFSDVLIEHGHQHDSCNSFFVNGNPCWSEKFPPIFKDVNAQKRLYECIGTRFLNKFLNKLDSIYPFVDNIKPFSRFISLFRDSAFMSDYGYVKISVVVWSIIKYLSTTLANVPNDILSHSDTEIIDSRPMLRNMLGKLSKSELKTFSENLREKGLNFNVPIKMIVEDTEKAERFAEFLSEHIEIIPDIQKDNSYLGINEEKGLLALKQGFIKNETEELIFAAKSQIKNNKTNSVIMGHTHESQNMPHGIKYLNTGCWTRFFDFSKNEKIQNRSFLSSYSYETFPYQLNYAEISDNVNRICLRTFRERNS